jgi:Family of unknown function (DUF5320)
MPRFDGTGPEGKGAMTGRGQGRCNPDGSPYNSQRGMGMDGGQAFGRGQGAGRGAGRNSGRSFSGKGSGAGGGKGRRR